MTPYIVEFERFTLSVQVNVKWQAFVIMAMRLPLL